MSIYEQQVRPFSQLNGPGGSHQPDGHQLSYLTKGEAKRCGGFFWLSWMICHFCGFFCETTKKAVPLGIPSCIFFFGNPGCRQKGRKCFTVFFKCGFMYSCFKSMCFFSMFWQRTMQKYRNLPSVYFFAFSPKNLPKGRLFTYLYRRSRYVCNPDCLGHIIRLYNHPCCLGWL